MLQNLSSTFHRISSAYTALLITLLYGYFIAVIMPEQSAMSATYEGSWGAPDQHFFYSPKSLYASIAVWGNAGRSDYISFRLNLDIIWALTYSGFLITFISLGSRKAFAPDDRRQLLNLTPLLPLSADLIENALAIWLVSAWPVKMEAVAWLAAVSTALKWSSLVAAHLVLLYILIYLLAKKLNFFKRR